MLTPRDWEEYKSSLTAIEPEEAGFEAAIRALLSSQDSNTFAPVRFEEAYIINQLPLLGVKDGLRYTDVPIQRQGDVVENISAVNATKASLLLGGREERPMDHLAGTTDFYFKDGLTLLIVAQQYQEVKVRYYFDPATIQQQHEFKLRYTGLVLQPSSRKLLATQPWCTRTHVYRHGAAEPLQ